MANYAAPLLNASIVSTFRTAGFLYPNATTPRRVQIYEIEFGQGGTLASSDIQVQWDVSRCATAGAAGTGVVPSPFDPSDSSPQANYLNQVTTEPTAFTTAGLGLSIKSWGINQRGSYRWRALDDGDNLIIPATAANAIDIRTLTSLYSGGQSALGSVSFVER